MIKDLFLKENWTTYDVADLHKYLQKKLNKKKQRLFALYCAAHVISLVTDKFKNEADNAPEKALEELTLFIGKKSKAKSAKQIAEACSVLARKAKEYDFEDAENSCRACSYAILSIVSPNHAVYACVYAVEAVRCSAPLSPEIQTKLVLAERLWQYEKLNELIWTK